MEVHVCGEIVGASDLVDHVDGVHCRWSLCTGTDWRVLQGTTEGHTHTDTAQSLQGEAVWAMPLDVHYAASSPRGWPKLRIEMFQQDVHGRNDVGGYGFCHVPPTPGVHDIDVVLWRPQGTTMEQWRAYFVGGHPKLKDPTMVNTMGDRFELHTGTVGRVHVRFELIVRGSKDQGLVLA